MITWSDGVIYNTHQFTAGTGLLFKTRCGEFLQGFPKRSQKTFCEYSKHVLEWGKENQGWTPGLVCRRGLMTNEPTGPNRPLMGTQREPTDPCGQAHRSRGSPRNKRRNPPEVSGFPTPQRSRRCHGIVVPKKMQKRSGKEWKRDYFSTTS